MIDLHMHSTFSDGSCTPEELIDIAEKQKLTAVALTDHDTTDGLARFIKAAEGRTVMAISGIEISAEFSPGTMHILGYAIKPGGCLEKQLKWIRDGRASRNQQILAKLQKRGLDLTWEEVASFAGNDVVGRPHFARAMLTRGYVKDKQEAFDRYLAKGRCAYVERRRLSPEDAIRRIVCAGGVPVLAHPFTLKQNIKKLRATLETLCTYGLRGLEVFYSEHSPRMEEEYAAVARELKLCMTGGSDFHGDINPDIRMGYGFGQLRAPDDLLVPLGFNDLVGGTGVEPATSTV